MVTTPQEVEQAGTPQMQMKQISIMYYIGTKNSTHSTESESAQQDKFWNRTKPGITCRAQNQQQYNTKNEQNKTATNNTNKRKCTA